MAIYHDLIVNSEVSKNLYTLPGLMLMFLTNPNLLLCPLLIFISQKVANKHYPQQNDNCLENIK